MAAVKKRKKTKILVMLKSSESHYSVVRSKNTKSANPNVTAKMSFRKYDPVLRKHVIFKEAKMPPHSK
jgi:large subunit ribosomal protein L33